MASLTTLAIPLEAVPQRPSPQPAPVQSGHRCGYRATVPPASPSRFIPHVFTPVAGLNKAGLLREVLPSCSNDLGSAVAGAWAPASRPQLSGLTIPGCPGAPGLGAWARCAGRLSGPRCAACAVSSRVRLGLLGRFGVSTGEHALSVPLAVLEGLSPPAHRQRSGASTAPRRQGEPPSR